MVKMETKNQAKKRLFKIIIILSGIISLGLLAYFVWLRFPSKSEKDAPIFSENAVRYEYSSNNMLGLKSITIDGNKYIYEFSAYKYFTRRKVDLFCSNNINADGYYDREIIGIIIHPIDDIDVFASGKSTYVVVVPEKGKGRYVGTELLFDKWYFNRRKKSIAVFHDRGAGVNETVFFYNKGNLRSTGQGYIDGKWRKKSKLWDSIWTHESNRYMYSDLW